MLNKYIQHICCAIDNIGIQMRPADRKRQLGIEAQFLIFLLSHKELQQYPLYAPRKKV